MAGCPRVTPSSGSRAGSTRGLRGRLLRAGELRVPAHATADLAGRTVLGHDTHGKHLLTRFGGNPATS